jgi:restriction system protein
MVQFDNLQYWDILQEIKSSDDFGFFHKIGFCPFCSKPARKANTKEWNKIYDPIDPTVNEYWEIIVHQCTCGWWDLVKTGNTGHDSVESGWELETLWYHAILKSFDLSDKNIPLEPLKDELLKNINKIHSIHYKKMEELVASVLKDYIGNCEVSICGKSFDGGIDIILIQSNIPMAIQVKRRMKMGKVESVNMIREFLGAMMLKGYHNGLYVTTAERFSPAAKIAVSNAIDNKLVSKYQLIDKPRFLDILKHIQNKKQIHGEPWEAYINELID